VTTPEVLDYRPRSVALRRRLVVLAVVAVARLLARRPPDRIRTVLERLRRGAAEAGHARTAEIRRTVVAVSRACTGPRGCLPRSLATALLCRLEGDWPTWCVGVRALPPFGAHAWVEAGGKAVGEPYPDGCHAVLFSVPAA